MGEERLLVLEGTDGALYAIPEAVVGAYRLDEAQRAALAGALDGGEVEGFGVVLQDRPAALAAMGTGLLGGLSVRGIIIHAGQPLAEKGIIIFG
jgi:hypothetical protein